MRLLYAKKMYQPRFLPHAIVLISFLATLSQGQTSFPVTLTLNPDEPITAGTSLLWSPSGQAAWDAMRMFHGVERLELVPPTPIADVLNDFQWDAASVLPAGTVVFGGEDSVARRAEIREELRKKVGPKAAAMIG
ncbi:MAG: hypothetical protein OJI67_05745, partial [Prosthecobacter sp.]|nr:hypothetical protein [Prosthecobacter sp.]